MTPTPTAQRPELLYVENTFGGDVTVLDTSSHEVVRSIEVGHHPDDVAVSADGSLLYVNRQGKRDVVAVDAKTGDILWKVPLSGTPHHIALSPDGHILYVAIFNELNDDVVDLEAREVVATPSVGYGSHGVRFSGTGERVYVGSMVFDHLAVVDARGFRPARTYNFEEAVRPFDLTADESRIYVQLSRFHGFLVVDRETGDVVEKVELPALPDDVPPARTFPHTIDHGINLTPDNRLLFVAATTGGYVAVYSVPDHELLTTIPVGKEPGWQVFNTDASLCYVSNRADNTVSVLSVAEMTEVGRIPVGNYPQRMAVAPAP